MDRSAIARQFGVCGCPALLGRGDVTYLRCERRHSTFHVQKSSLLATSSVRSGRYHAPHDVATRGQGHGPWCTACVQHYGRPGDHRQRGASSTSDTGFLATPSPGATHSHALNPDRASHRDSCVLLVPDSAVQGHSTNEASWTVRGLRGLTRGKAVDILLALVLRKQKAPQSRSVPMVGGRWV